MILSSSDIFRILSNDPLIRASARVKIIEGKPPIEADDTTVIYISRYPTVFDLQAVWTVWITDISNEPIDVILAQLNSLLPGFQIEEDGIITRATVTELRSAKTETVPVPVEKPENKILVYLQNKFDDLRQSIDDRMLLVGPGRPGKDGKDGKKWS